jgi:hypothetical protein
MMLCLKSRKSLVLERVLCLHERKRWFIIRRHLQRTSRWNVYVLCVFWLMLATLAAFVLRVNLDVAEVKVKKGEKE